RDKSQQLEIFLHHADNPVILAVQPNTAAYDCWIGGKVPHPKIMTQDNHVVVTQLIFAVCKGTSQLGRDPEHPEVVRRYRCGTHRFRLPECPGLAQRTSFG